MDEILKTWMPWENFRIGPRGRRGGRVNQVRDYTTQAAVRFLWNSIFQKRHSTSFMSGPRARKTYSYGQRCTVKVNFVTNAYKSHGNQKEYKMQWSRHGYYLMRPEAQLEKVRGLGFDENDEDVNIAKKLGGWQEEGDDRMWKLIVSPERGGDIDLKEHTRGLMRVVEKDLGTKLEYVAIEHHNTAHPHVHLVIRGKREDGQVLMVDREYFSHGFRSRSQEILTQKLGLRTELDVLENRKKIINARHITDIDREINKKLTNDHIFNLDWNIKNGIYYQKNLQIKQRLEYLEELGVAKEFTSASWYVDPKFIDYLKFTQEQDDILKTKYKHINNILEPNLKAIENKLPNVGDRVVGRVVGSGISERTEERYLLIEGKDSKLHQVQMNIKLAMLRDNGELPNDAIVQLERAEISNRKPIQKTRLSAIEGIKDTMFDPTIKATVWEEIKGSTTEVRLKKLQLSDDVIKSRIHGDFEKIQSIVREAEEIQKIPYIKVNVVNEQKQEVKLDQGLKQQQTPKIDAKAREPHDLMGYSIGEKLIEGRMIIQDPELDYMMRQYAQAGAGFDWSTGQTGDEWRAYRQSQRKSPWEEMSGMEMRTEFYTSLQKDLGEMGKRGFDERVECMVDKAFNPKEPLQGFYQTALIKCGAQIYKDGSIHVSQSAKNNALEMSDRGLSVKNMFYFVNQDLQQELSMLRIVVGYMLGGGGS